MTCNGCVAKTKSELLKLGEITEAEVKLTAPQAIITMQKHIPVAVLQNTLSKAGNFTIAEAADGGMHHVAATEETASWLTTYKPILIIGAYITGITLLVEAARGAFNWDNWMQNFMAGFFLVFSFFKLLNLKGFAESYSTYDIIAKKMAWLGLCICLYRAGLRYCLPFKLQPPANEFGYFFSNEHKYSGCASKCIK